ncbi:ATP-binding protein [Bradyrhizobium sp. GCM10027634]|uniref:sensor histidine kinase n=1 Tax=unclassified Bradyrhizobium TaxID=2631580 RepID=UPI00188C85F7|nr:MULTISPECIES: HAMP domain-containing sensor histidine kinase [unclassified Bradyrhizobium]MDN4999325.1 HAMP domain-containing sensor histidine kinase [Bradyrhizobium sp. WYCCWR 12677]QOZ43726.1 ATPase [Bradyrhizobium sp. CCBAU 53340]
MSRRNSIASTKRRVAGVALLCLGLTLWLNPGVGPVDAAGEGRVPKRVLLLHSFGRDFLPWSEYARSIKTNLEQRSPWPLDIQEHTLLTARFTEPGPEGPFVEYIRSIYQGRPPDIVMSIGGPAAGFVQRHRAELFPKAPMVLTTVEERLIDRASLTEQDTVVSVRNDFVAAFRNALQVLPDTRTIALVIGASALEKFWLDEVKRDVAPLKDRVSFVWYGDLPFEEILKQASALPPHTVLFWGLMSVDAAGVVHDGDRALHRLRAVANAPIFCFEESFFGRNIVGGPMHSISELGEKTADAALRILGGEKPADVKIEPIAYAVPKYDWRELQRWGINESNLPEGSEVLFREPGIWEEYRWQLALIAAVILIQAGLISGLLHERRGRRLAEVESRQRLAELAHVNRYAAVGELTASIAHELNQPLGSILTNAETAELMLKGTAPDLAEIGEILADIRRDDQRAGEVIRRLRSVLKKAPFEIKDIELNETVREAIGLVGDVAAGRNIALGFYAPPEMELHVKGDPVQLQQVVLNLILNALEAISESPAGKREVSVTMGRSAEFAEIRVGDTGPGIAGGDLKTIFEPFFTTKLEGMGMGLAIVRTIVEAHHGTISAENQPFGGALFTVRLPIASWRPALQ